MVSAPSPLARRLVRQRVESQMNAQITVLRGPISTLDSVTGIVSGLVGADPIYTGKARIHPVTSAGVDNSGGGPVARRRAVISIPIDSPVPHRDDLITVQATNRDSDASEADADLDTRVFRVTDVDGGSYFGDARRLTCDQVFDSRYWPTS